MAFLFLVSPVVHNFSWNILLELCVVLSEAGSPALD